MKNSQKKLVQGGALDATKKLGKKVNSPGPWPHIKLSNYFNNFLFSLSSKILCWRRKTSKPRLTIHDHGKVNLNSTPARSSLLTSSSTTFAFSASHAITASIILFLQLLKNCAAARFLASRPKCGARHPPSPPV